jgi:hypothetical protein
MALWTFNGPAADIVRGDVWETARLTQVLAREYLSVQADLAALRQRHAEEVDDLRSAIDTNVEIIKMLRQRHDEAVEKAFREGRHTDRLAGDTEAWLASEAKKELT